MPTSALDAALAEAVRRLGRGEVVAFPTETFYGLGVDALAPAALEALLRLKGRDAAKGISVLIDGEAMLAVLCARVPVAARRLMAAHWPGALTIALPAREGLPSALVNEGCVAVRVSPHPVAQALVRAFGRPVTATSANHAGQPPTRTAEEVARAFGPSLTVVDGGATPGGLPSTVVRVRDEGVEVLRPGAVVVAV